MRTFYPQLSVMTAALLSVAAALSTTTACADMKLTDEAAGFYAGAGIGRSDYRSACSSPGAVTSGCDTQDTSWKLYGGYQLNKWLSAEAAYLGLGNANYSGTIGATPFNAETETWGISAQLVGQLSLPFQNEFLHRFAVLGKVGTLYWDQSLSSSGPLSGSETGWGLAWGVGLQYTFNEHLGIRGEWEQYDNVGTPSTGGRSDLNVWTVGLNYKF